MAVNLNVISQFDAKGLNRAQSELDKLAANTSNISTKLAGAAKVAGAGIMIGAAQSLPDCSRLVRHSTKPSTTFASAPAQPAQRLRVCKPT